MTDYFLPRRLIQMIIEDLQPKGYVFSHWTVRGEEYDNAVYEFTFTIPSGKQQVSTGISKYELEHQKTKLRVVAGVLGKRAIKAVEESMNLPPPSPS